MFMMSEFAFYVVYFIVIVSILLVTLALDYMIKYECYDHHEYVQLTIL